MAVLAKLVVKADGPALLLVMFRSLGFSMVIQIWKVLTTEQFKEFNSVSYAIETNIVDNDLRDNLRLRLLMKILMRLLVRYMRKSE